LRGQRVYVSIKSSDPHSLAVYLLSDAQYQAWRTATSACSPEEAGTSYILKLYRVTDAVFNWTSPTDGAYRIIIVIFSNSECQIIFSVTKQYSLLVEQASYATVTSLLIVASAQTLTGPVGSLTLAPVEPTTLLMIIVLSVVLAVLLAIYSTILVKRRRIPYTYTRVTVQIPALAQSDPHTEEMSQRAQFNFGRPHH
jgi:hypothetical protein